MNPLDWILDHMQLIALVAAGIVSILAQRKRKADAEEVHENMPPPVDESELERQIREDIARRRAEREGKAPSEVEMPRPFTTSTDEQRESAPGLDEWAEPAPVAPPPLPTKRQVEDAEAVLARQLELQEKLEALRREREATQARAKAATDAIYAQSGTGSAKATTSSGLNLAGLRNPAEARRAIIAMEVLGRPKAFSS